MKIQCPECGKRGNAPDGYTGKIRCPRCKKTMILSNENQLPAELEPFRDLYQAEESSRRKRKRIGNIAALAVVALVVAAVAWYYLPQAAEQVTALVSTDGKERQAVREWLKDKDCEFVFFSVQAATVAEHTKASSEAGGGGKGKYIYAFVKLAHHRKNPFNNERVTTYSEKVFAFQGGKIVEEVDLSQAVVSSHNRYSGGWQSGEFGGKSTPAADPTERRHFTRVAWEEWVLITDEIFLIAKRVGWLYAGGKAELK